jgi:dihydroorotase
MALLIKNAKIINANKAAERKTDILIDRGVILKIAPSIKEDDAKVIDASGKLVMPGFVDMHVHLREPGREDKETIATGSKAAAKGGFTSIVCMPNTTPTLDNAMVIEAVIKEAKRVGLVNVYPSGAITRDRKNEELTDMFELKTAGCVAVTDDGTSVTNSGLLRSAIEYADMAGLLVMEHCQDPDLTREGVMNEGEISTMLGFKGDPAAAETSIVARDIEIAFYLGRPVHFQHISLKRSVELIKMAKKQGIRISAEATPHHFSLTEEEVRSFNTNTKVNPPLRTKEDVTAIKEALRDGVLDCIATDHAPHSLEDKEVDFDHAPPGVIGLETAFALTVTELVEQGYLNWPQVAEKMSLRPAQLLRLENKGEVKEGADADLVIVDPEKEWVVEESDIVSKSKNSPFMGKKLKGRVLITICGGKITYQE